jgi:transcriptional regulator with XRE-family HTH domain
MIVISPSEALRWARAQAGMNQSAVADRSGVSQAAVSQFERNQRSPRFFNFVALANACGFDVVLVKRESSAP